MLRVEARVSEAKKHQRRDRAEGKNVKVVLLGGAEGSGLGAQKRHQPETLKCSL